MTFEQWWECTGRDQAVGIYSFPHGSFADVYNLFQSFAAGAWSAAKDDRDRLPVTNRLGRLDGLDVLVRISDDAQHTLESRLLAEACIVLRTIGETLKKKP
jgi:hypothetical protein